MPRKIREYASDGITVRYDAVRCIHEAECVHGLPVVFNQDRRPWIDPSGAPPGDIARVVVRCPTGALTYQRHDGGPAETAPAENSIGLGEDGPLYASGDIRVVDGEGTEVFAGTRVALCRCGASTHKPFCDGKHVEVSFTDPGVAVKHPPEAEQSSGSLTITMAPNGPLIVSGPYTLVAAQGSRSCAEKGALCRCGQSSTKPMCDGSHKTSGFVG